MIRAASFYAALPSTTAVATAITATAVVIAAFKAEVTAADPDAEVGARSAVLSRSAGGSTGRIRFLSAFIFLSVSASLLIALLAGWWHAMRYYVWEPPNIHPGGYHAMILTILHTRVPFRTSLSPNPTRWRSSESPQKPIRKL